jgi:hypothetical protein
MDVGEVAAPSARDQDLLSRAVGMIDQQDRAAALPRYRGAHQAGGACAEDDGVIGGQRRAAHK